MKNIDEFIVWTSVKTSKISLLGFFTLCVAIFIGEKTAYFSLQFIFCLLLSLTLLSYINSREDELYQKFWPKNTEDPDKLFEIRGQSVWLPLFLGAIILFFIK